MTAFHVNLLSNFPSRTLTLPPSKRLPVTNYDIQRKNKNYTKMSKKMYHQTEPLLQKMFSNNVLGNQCLANESVPIV